VLNNPTIRGPIAISLGAIAGALSRYYLTLWFSQRFGSELPYGTFFINLTGCLLMGFFTAIAASKFPTLSPDIRLLVTTGFLGAYTTFSTYGLDTVNLWSDRGIIPAGLYWIGSAVLGILSIKLGAHLGMKI
jgi:fluoride exporter